MGWLFGYDTRKELADHLIRGNGAHMLKHCWVGNNLWTVQEWTKQDGSVVRFVALYMCKGNRHSKYAWRYKDVDESMGPDETSCPLSYIELVEAHEKEHGYAPVGYAAEWRQRVRDRVTKSKRKFEVGQRIRLYGREYVVAHVFPNGVYGVYDIDNGSTMYRLKRSQIKYVEMIE